MHGVYVLDLDGGQFFVCIGEHLPSIQEAFLEEQRRGTLPMAKMDGSYHYYPCLPGETDDDAERRIFALAIRLYGLGNVWARLPLRETLAKGTWSPGCSHSGIPDSAPSSANEEKGGVFSISI